MKQCLGLFVLATGVLFGLTSPVSAQVTSTGAVQVIVEDADGGRG